MASPAAKKILIEDFGYQPVDIESKSAYSRAVRETVNKLKLENPKDPRIKTLQDAVRPSRKRTTKKESTKKESTQPKKTKDDAIKFIRGRGTPEPVEPTTPTIPKFGGEKTGAALTSISQTVNAIKKLVTRQNKFEKEKVSDTREAREKKKRSMAENLMEGGKKMFGKVANTFKKVLEPAKGIFESIFNFIKLFFLGSALMKILDWFGNPDNKDKISSIFRFLKDFWPAIAAGVIALMGPIPAFVAAIGLAFTFVPKIIDFVKSIFGLGKDVDKEVKKEEKDYEKSKRGTAFDDTTVTTETRGPTTAFAEDAEGNEITDLNKREEISNKAREAMPMNKGGEVPGQGNTDTVPAMLTPGEFVLTKEAVKKVGADTLYGINAAAGGVGKSNDVPRGSSGKPMKKKSTVQTMMDMGGLNPINNISKSMSNVTNNTSNDMSKSMSNVTNNTSNNMSKSMSNVTNNSSSDVTNNKSNVTNKTIKTMNMSGGGMTKNSYNSGGVVTNNIGGTSNTQYMKLGGMVKNFISKTPQARLIKFAAKQIKKSPVGTPVSKVFKKLRTLGAVPPAPSTDMGGDPTLSGETIPKFSVIAPGGRAKEQTLGVRR